MTSKFKRKASGQKEEEYLKSKVLVPTKSRTEAEDGSRVVFYGVLSEQATAYPSGPEVFTGM